MTKKSLKGFLKTQHFQDRQRQRQVTDLAIIKAITQGQLTENDYGHNFLLGNLKVTVDLASHTLITVHPGDPATRSQKVLTKEMARELSELIEAHQRSQAKVEDPAENDFLKFVHEFAVKKI